MYRTFYFSIVHYEQIKIKNLTMDHFYQGGEKITIYCFNRFS